MSERLQFNPAKYHYTYRVTPVRVGRKLHSKVVCPELGEFASCNMSREDILRTGLAQGLLYRQAGKIAYGDESFLTVGNVLPQAIARGGQYRTWVPSFAQCARMFLCDVVNSLTDEERFRWWTAKSRWSTGRFVEAPIPGKDGKTQPAIMSKLEIGRFNEPMKLEQVLDFLHELGYLPTIVDPEPF